MSCRHIAGSYEWPSSPHVDQLESSSAKHEVTFTPEVPWQKKAKLPKGLHVWEISELILEPDVTAEDPVVSRILRQLTFLNHGVLFRDSREQAATDLAECKLATQSSRKRDEFEPIPRSPLNADAESKTSGKGEFMTGNGLESPKGEVTCSGLEHARNEPNPTHPASLAHPAHRRTERFRHALDAADCHPER
jgi:hypothetical protein